VAIPVELRLQHFPLDRLGFLVGVGGYSEPRYSAPGPYLLIYVLRDRGPQPICVGQLGGDQPSILPLDLNLTLNFRLYFILISFTILS
jgi:hypothetical protein